MKLYFYTILAIVAAACTKIERLEGVKNTEKKLVVNCFYNFDNPMQFEVSHTLSVLDNAKINYIKNAVIILFENEVPVDTIKTISANKYTSKITAKEGKSYSIKVSAPGYKTVAAYSEPMYKLNVAFTDFVQQNRKTVNNAKTQFDNLSLKLKTSSSNRNVGKLTISFETSNILSLSTTDSSNSYYISANIGFKANSGNWTRIMNNFEDYYSSSLILDHTYSADNSLFGLNSETIFDMRIENFESYGQNININDLFYYFYVSNDLNVNFKFMNSAVYDYFVSIHTYQNSQGELLAQPAKIISNVENGEGIFGYLQQESASFAL